jgi:hypothetical protein
MKSRDFGVLLFGLAGLYSLLLALLGVAQLLMQVPASTAMAGGQLRIQATFINAVLSVLLHLAFGALLLGQRRGLTLWLLGHDETAATPATAAAAAAAAGKRTGTMAGGGAKGGSEKGGGAIAGAAAGVEAAGEALGFATVGVCMLAILLLARVVTALSYGASLLWLRGNTGDYVFWTAGGIVTDLLLAAAGGLLIARRHRVAARLLAIPAGPAGSARARAGAGWQLPAARFLGLAVLVWYLPELVSALSVFVKWGLRPVGFDLRSQALDRIPPAATGVVAGLYLFLLFPLGLSAVWRRLRPRRDEE